MPLPPEDIEAWALAYIAAQETWDRDSDEELPLAISQLNDLNADPEDVWRVILHVLPHCTSEKVLDILAAGPLEDLIDYHGEAMIDRIERKAVSNPVFKRLLCGVWPSSSKEIWARVEEARGYSEPPPKKVLGLIDFSPQNPAVPNQAAVLASIENEFSIAMLANGYLTNSPFRSVGVYIHFDAPPSSHAVPSEWLTSGMGIVTTIAFSRETMFLLDSESQRTVIRDAVLMFLRKVAFAFRLPARFLSHDAS